MRVRLACDKYNFIWTGIAIFLAAVMYFTVGYAWWVLPLYGGLFFLSRCIQVDEVTRLPWLWSLVLFVLGAIVNTLSIQYLLLSPELFQRTKLEMLGLNVLCCLVFYLVFQLLVNSTVWTCTVCNITFLIFGFINYFVYLFRQNEFAFSDLRSIGTGLSVAGQYELRLNDKGCYVIFACALYVSLARRVTVTFAKRWKMSLAMTLTAVACTLVLVLDTAGVNTETWEQKGTYRNGYVLNFVLGVRDSFVGKPEGYSDSAIAELEQQYGALETGRTLCEVKNPTIIVIMNESFSDLSVLGELRTNMETMPFIHSLTENTVKGYALSSVFGAKTPNSEWEFLSGHSMAFLPSGSVVYQQYISETPTTLVSTLKQKNYTCVAMHPYYATGWSRNLIYPNIGYDEMYFIDAFNQKKLYRKYITDEEMYRKVIERFENRKANEKLFIMGITMQNHGGYTETYDNFPEKIYKTGNSYTDANQYLSLVRASDDAVRDFINYFSQVEEPVEIVFFGDHQPSLTTDFYTLLNGKGLSGLNEEELEHLYTVPFFIWTNYETPAEDIEITSLDYLSTMALERAGMELPPYNQFMADLQKVIPAVNSRGYYSNTDKAYKKLEEAQGIEKEWLKRYEILQYNSMFDRKNRSELFFPYMK